MARKKEKKSGRDTAFFLVLGVFLAIAVNFGMSIVMATEYPIVAVESNSMTPFFYRGDILIVKGAGEKDLDIGDVIVFSVPDRKIPIVHRIVAKNEDNTYQTKGDANQGQHPWEKSVGMTQIKGKEVFILPLLGWVKIGITEVISQNILPVIVLVIVVTFIYLLTNKKERY